jgi:trans-aconitate 2-methyltransferase
MFMKDQSREWDAASYHRVSSPQFAWGERVVDSLRLGGGETVMDAGCGTGRFTSLLLERLPRGRVVAVVFSQNRPPRTTHLTRSTTAG